MTSVSRARSRALDPVSAVTPQISTLTEGGIIAGLDLSNPTQII